MKRIILVLVVMLGIEGRVEASFQTGSELLNDCESEIEIICLGYLEGISDVHDTLLGWRYLKKPYFCVPIEATAGQLQKVFIKYANNHPEKLHFSASSMVLVSFREAFPPPCD